MASQQQGDDLSDIDLQKLNWSLRKPRMLFSMMLSVVVTIMMFAALIPLFSVVVMLFYRGASNLKLANFYEVPPVMMQEEVGGFGNALVGTLVMVGIAALISVPFGVLAAIFLAELGSDSKAANIIRFCAKVLSGFPSILAGIFTYGAIVLVMGFSAYAGGVALSILMLPIVMLTAEEAIRMVPSKMKEASYGMGATPTQTLWHVTLPTAFPGILTGVMLAVARASGETAPLLFTAMFSGDWLMYNWHVNLNQSTASMAVLIYNFSGQSDPQQVEMAWSASLVLVLLVLAVNLIGKSLSSSGPKR